MRKRGLLLLATAFAAAVGCGVPHDRKTQVRASSAPSDPSQCQDYGFAKDTLFRDFSTDCGDPKSGLLNADGVPTGPIIQMSLFFNCNMGAGETWYQRYDWFQCLNDVQHPSGGQPVITWSPGCMLTDGLCVINQLPDDAFEVDARTPDGMLLRALLDKIAKARATLKAQGGGANINDQLKIIDAATLFADLADSAFVKQQRALAMRSVSLAAQLADLAVNFLPGAAMVRDAIIVITGTNPITGETVDDTQRVITAAMLVVPSFLEGGVHGLVDLGEALEDVAKSSKSEAALAQDLYGALGRSDSEVAEFVNGLPCNFSRAPAVGHAPLPEACGGGVGDATAQITAEGQRVRDWLKEGNVGFGEATTTKYNPAFKAANADVADQIGQVHHAVPQTILDKYPDLLTPEQMHSLENLRGMPLGDAGVILHQKTITPRWNQYLKGFADQGIEPTLDDLLKFAKDIDNMYGSQFVPPIR